MPGRATSSTQYPSTARFDLPSGTLLVVLPPDWVLLVLTVGGLVLLVFGTAWNAIRRGRHDEDEDVPRE